MDNKYKAWLEKLKTVWEESDYSLLKTIISSNISYWEYPFHPPFTSKQKIIKQWKEDLVDQRNIHFRYEIINANTDQCISHWRSSFFRKSKQESVNLDGIFLVKLDINGRCTYFKQWWVVK